VPFENTEKKWKSECLRCGRIVYPKHHTVKQRSGGCKYCSNKGLDFTLPAYIYLITHPELQAHKVGIGGEYANEDRLRGHAKQGWVLYEKKTYRTADMALDVEQEVLQWLRSDLQLPPYLSREQMPQSGWTETIDASEIDLPSIWAKIVEVSSKRTLKGQ
jgi:DNA-directed RNA polymerase subunit RPC12/RpoP